MKNLTIAHRILLMIGASVLALLLVGFVGVRVADKGGEGIRLINDDSLVSIQKLSKLQKDFLMLNVSVYAHVLNTDAFSQLSFDQKFESNSKNFLQSLKEYEKLVSNDEDKKMLEADSKSVMAFLDVVSKEIIPQSRVNKKAEAKLVLEDKASPLGEKALAALDAHMAFEEKRAAEVSESVLGDNSRGRMTAIIGILAGVVIVGLLGFFMLTNIRSSLKQIQSMVNKVESDLDFTVRVNVSKQDEIGLTTSALNRLLDKLQDSLKSIARGAQSVAAASHQVASSSSQVATASQQQSEAASDMAATVEEMTVSINHVADRAQEASRISIESGRLASSGEKIIGQTAADIQEIAATVHQAAELIHGLEQHSQQISNVVTVIKEVADQTNLLALNAAIEAARAGEQGRGFAVVADEVRKLAERTSSSTQEIAGTIDAMRASAGDAVGSMQCVVDIVSKGVERAKEANASIKQIGEGSRNAVAMVEEIATAIREQGAATNNIAAQVERIAQMSEESSASIGNGSHVAQELDHLAADMQRTVSAYRL